MDAQGENRAPAPVGAGRWTLRLGEEKPCDFSDRHQLSGVSASKRVVLAVGATAVFAVVVALGAGATLGIWVGGAALGLWLAAGYSTRLQGDDLVVRRFGVAKVVPLREVREARLYRYRNNLSLQLRNAAGKRLGDISARVLRQNPETAAHLRHWLDRPEVSWGSGAWQLIAPFSSTMHVPVASPADGAAPADASGSANADAPADVDDPQSSGSRPRGRFVPARPQSKWVRGAAWFSVAIVLVTALAFLVIVPVQWSDYELSQRIQHGGEALATLESEWVTSSSSRSGTSYTTHFDVTFTTANGTPISTAIEAPGSFVQEPEGDHLLVAYDPSHPQSAELPGHPNHTFEGTLVLTLVAVSLWVMSALGIRRFVRVRRAKRAAAPGRGMATAG